MYLWSVLKNRMKSGLAGKLFILSATTGAFSRAAAGGAGGESGGGGSTIPITAPATAPVTGMVTGMITGSMPLGDRLRHAGRVQAKLGRLHPPDLVTKPRRFLELQIGRGILH